MAKIDRGLQKAIDGTLTALLRADDAIRSLEYQKNKIWPSGRLAAGRLAEPLQWQALRSFSAPREAVEDYALRLFLRGRQIEDWFVSQMTLANVPFEEQLAIEYREVVGFVDMAVQPSVIPALVKGYHDLTIPWEVKSVKASKFSRVRRQNAPDRSHRLQGCLYALAMKAPAFTIIYIASDDLRVMPFTLATADVKAEVDQVIDRFQSWQLDCRVNGDNIPLFMPEEPWQSNPKYNGFVDWMDLDEVDCRIKLAIERAAWVKAQTIA